MGDRSIVLDANILIRAVLGRRVRELVGDSADKVQFFSPDVAYADARKYLPELSHLPGGSAHEPWDSEHGYSYKYPKRIVDHATERVEALARLSELKTL
jgi:hypothetical protein